MTFNSGQIIPLVSSETHSGSKCYYQNFVSRMKIAKHLIPVDCTDVTIVGMVSAMPTTIRPKRTMIPNIQLGAAGTKHVTDEIHSTNNV